MGTVPSVDLLDLMIARPSCALYEAEQTRLFSTLPEGSATLVYADPPFFTQRSHNTNSRSRRERGEEAAFEDQWESLDAYLAFLESIARGAHRVLSSHGSFVLHLDSKTCHEAKVRCDAVFGRDAFASEIIWRYRRWPAKTKNFQRVHDVLLRWVRDKDAVPRWNQIYEPLAPSTLKTWGDRKQEAVFRDGKRAVSSRTKEPSKGVPCGDVWDIGIIAPVATERTGYPTQKPRALLERLIAALTDKGDLVVDPCCGSGTTLDVARSLGRVSVGGDTSPVALRIAAERLGVVVQRLAAP